MPYEFSRSPTAHQGYRAAGVCTCTLATKQAAPTPSCVMLATRFFTHVWLAAHGYACTSTCM